MLYQAIEKYNELLSKEYHWRIGHKNNEKVIELIFTKEMFPHLIGLHYLNDLEQLKSNKQALYDKILKQQITQSDLEKSLHFKHKQIQNRISDISHLEQMLDELGKNSKLFYRRNTNGSIHQNSKILADYVISFNIDKERIVYFIKNDRTKEKFIGVSLFRMTQLDYTNPNQVIEMKALKLDKTYFKHPNYKPTI